MPMKWSIEHKVLSGFAVALVILAGIGGLAYQSTLSFMETSRLAARSQENITALAEIFSLLNQAETRQRIYIISGSERYLTPRHASIDRIRTLTESMRQATADDPGQQKLLAELVQRIDKRLLLLNGVLKARQEQGFEAGRAKLLAGDGEREMEAVHAIIVQMEEGERVRLKRWVEMSQKDAERMRAIFFLAFLSVAAFFGVLFVLIRREMAERKRAQNELSRLVTELSAANEELKNFAYIVSHDLKAPLRAIGSLADWLTTDQAGKLDDEGREHLSLLNQRVRRMDGLIEGILQYSRVGRVRETQSKVDLNQLLRDVIDSLAPPEHIAITVAGALPTIRTEKTRIQQVFQNLLSNAIKYMDKPHGEIRIDCTDAGEDWEFSVSDNGPGIEARHFKRIFQLFQTLAPRDRVESTGVGLALVKKIIELYGGKIWLESKPGEGSTFFFTLPKGAANTKGESR